MDDSKIIISGGLAGFAQILTGYPFDTVKVRYIKDNHKTLFSCIKSIKKTGYKSFYRGVSSPLVGSLFTNVKTFYLYSWCNKYTSNYLVSGSITGLGLAIIETPTDLIKSRMQINQNLSYKETIKEITGSNYNNNNNYKKLYKGLYKGLNITMLRNSISVGLYFWGYENTKKIFSNEYIGTFIGGSVAGLCCWGPNYPMDNIKTRIQTDTTGKYKGIIDCIKKTSTKQLYKGFIPCVTRSMIVNPFVFLAYETGIKHLQ